MANDVQVTCTFQNRILNKLREPRFQLHAESREPCLCFKIDGRSAMLPLGTVVSAMEMEAGSADGEMLLLVSKGLAFRRVIKPGDVIPSEVTTGKASWAISPHHQLAAAAHLPLAVLRWQGAESSLGPLDATTLTTSDKVIRANVACLLEKAASALDFGANTRALQAIIDDLAGEAAYVDAAHEQFTKGTQTIAARLRKLARPSQFGTAAQCETTMQALSLLLVEERKARVVADASKIHPGNVEKALRNAEETRSILRIARDRLYGMVVTWTDQFERWERPVSRMSGGDWAAADCLHKFLARLQIS